MLDDANVWGLLREVRFRAFKYVLHVTSDSTTDDSSSEEEGEEEGEESVPHTAQEVLHAAGVDLDLTAVQPKEGAPLELVSQVRL